VSTGVLSVITNVGATTLVMTLTGLPVVAANVLAVALASIVNFLVSDRLVFGR
jgi:putative flippase GtrA